MHFLLPARTSAPGADSDGLSEEGHVGDAVGVEGDGCGGHRSRWIWQQAREEN